MDGNQSVFNMATETSTMPSSTAPEIEENIHNGKCQDEESDATSTKKEINDNARSHESKSSNRSELHTGESKNKDPDTKKGKDINTNLGTCSNNQSKSNMTTDAPAMSSSTAPEIEENIHNGKCQDEESDATSTKKEINDNARSHESKSSNRSELHTGESKNKDPDTKNEKDINTNLGTCSNNQSKSNMTTEALAMSSSTAPDGKDLNTNNKLHCGKCQDAESDTTSTKKEPNGESKNKDPDTKYGENSNLRNCSDNQSKSNITTDTMSSITAPDGKDLNTNVKINSGKRQDEESDATSATNETLTDGESKDKDPPDTTKGENINTNLRSCSDNQSKSNMIPTNNKIHSDKRQNLESDASSANKDTLTGGESKDTDPDTTKGKDINTNLRNCSDNQNKSNMTTETTTKSSSTAPEGTDLNTNNKIHCGKCQDEESDATSTKKQINGESKDKDPDTLKRKNAKLRNCSDNYMGKVGIIFGKYGRNVATYPLVFIITPLIVCGLFGLGLLNMSSESDIETLYVPINSRTASDRTKINSTFPDKSDSNFYEQSLGVLNLYGDIIIKSRDNRDVLSLEVVDEIKNITLQLKTFSFEDGGLNLTYTDVCAVRDWACLINGEFILGDDFIQLYKGGKISYPKWTDPQGVPKDLSVFMKGSANASMVLKSVSSLYLKFNLRQKNISRSQKWETEFLEFISKMSTNLTDIAYSASSSLDQELNSNTGQDIFWFSISFTLLITYASVVASGGNCVSNRSHLARAGVIGVALAILASFGILSLFGLKFVNIVGVMPFLALGVGVDSMFVIMSEWAEHHHKATTEDQMEATLKGCGGSITIASLTDVTAFFIGASSQFISIRNFCIYTGLALAISYVCHITFFIGCLALQGRRVRAKRHCLTCLKTEDKPTMELAKKNRFIVFLCSGKSADKREDDESLCEKLPRICLTKTILKIVTKAVVIVVFLIYLGWSICGVVNLKQGLILSNLISDTSYFNKYESWRSSDFETKFSISFTFENIDYLNEAQVNSMRHFMESVQRDSVVESNSLLCWYDQYNFSNVSQKQFISNLKTFLTHRQYISNDIEFTSDGSAVKASRCYVFTVNLPDSTDQGNLMLRMRELADASELNVFAYTPPFIFFEQYVVILPNTIQTVGIAVICMLVITIMFMPHTIMVVLVTLNMISILVGIFGFLYFWDLTLSSITMIHLIMSVGFSVDFSVHVCHGFMSSDKDNKDDRVRDALKTSAAPVINGGLSSLIGICTLAGSQSYVFRSFFKIMLLVISFGLAHSMLLLPVILSLIGPGNDCNNKVDLLPSQTAKQQTNISPNTSQEKPNTDASLTPTELMCNEWMKTRNKVDLLPSQTAKQQTNISPNTSQEKPNTDASLTPTELMGNELMKTRNTKPEDKDISPKGITPNLTPSNEIHDSKNLPVNPTTATKEQECINESFNTTSDAKEQTNISPNTSQETPNTATGSKLQKGVGLLTLQTEDKDISPKGTKPNLTTSKEIRDSKTLSANPTTATKEQGCINESFNTSDAKEQTNKSPNTSQETPNINAGLTPTEAVDHESMKTRNTKPEDKDTKSNSIKQGREPATYNTATGAKLEDGVTSQVSQTPSPHVAVNAQKQDTPEGIIPNVTSTTETQDSTNL